MKNIHFVICFLLFVVTAGAFWFLGDSSENYQSVAAYNCTFSDGEFTNGRCECPFEEQLGQTSESMYDKNTGFCQSTIGGPAGDAFNASIGFPHSRYEYYFSIIDHYCTESGGQFLHGSCDCFEKTYNKQNGLCE